MNGDIEDHQNAYRRLDDSSCSTLKLLQYKDVKNTRKETTKLRVYVLDRSLQNSAYAFDKYSLHQRLGVSGVSCNGLNTIKRLRLFDADPRKVISTKKK
ncbi:unnamed protein product [Haemonchus placei]|uniref:Uncharacterized protein n=1 Tax=Haemonchus placei TaxID=6290 RepID=A0A0N4WBT5_HAEPC|nr:unnamed protein product [Haemonchus placei]